MTIQKCNRCLKDKELELFYWNPSGKSRRKICKQCFADADKAWRSTHREQHNAGARHWYQANPEKQREINSRNYVKQNAKRDEIKEKVLNDNPCIVCGETEQILLDFHHLDPSEKEHNIGEHSLTWRKMLKEISKCVVLCCKCHRRYHAGVIKLSKPLVPVDTTGYF